MNKRRNFNFSTNVPGSDNVFGNTDKSMDAGASPLPDNINPNNFLAKLWRLVNNPEVKAICWDREGQIIIIDTHLLETQILFPCTDNFKTSKVSSFVRQLNLYGFKKAMPPIADSNTGDNVGPCYFSNPNFKRNHPKLVASLRRLTVGNKAKMQADLDKDGRDNYVIGGSSSLHNPTHQEAPCPFYPSRAQAVMAHTGTPVPPQLLITGHAAPLSLAVFIPVNVTPVLLSHHFHANQPGYYSPRDCRCFELNRVAPHTTGSELQTGPFSPHSHYQVTSESNISDTEGHQSGPQQQTIRTYTNL